MIKHNEVSATELRALIKAKVINFGGNKNLKIFGLLNCSSGKRMHKQNRVFFTSVYEAQYLGYRPCGHCMKKEYTIWKNTHGSI